MKESVRSGWGKNLNVKVFYESLDTSWFLGVPKMSIESGLAVGLGRSYGDSSLNGSGVSFTTEKLDTLEICPNNKTAICGSGVTIGELERAASKHGLFPVVVPGTEFVTVGGAIASNIHGKSHHTDGSFGDHILEISLINYRGKEMILTPDGESQKAFWATVGGMGLTGVISQAKLRLKPIETTFMSIEEVRVKNLEEMLGVLNSFDAKYSNTAAWIDASGKYEGRGIVAGANHAKIHELSRKERKQPLKLKTKRRISLPRDLSISLINTRSVRLFNTFWYRKPLKRRITHFQTFLHPLDSILNWNSIYGRTGFLQYQFAVPYNREKLLFEFINLMKTYNVASFLTVLKKLGGKDSKFISFPIGGWTLAVDFSTKETEFINALKQFDQRLIESGGRVYLTKDSRLNRTEFEKMYPEYKDWKTVKASMDPETFWKSNQGERLGLC